MRTNWFHSRRGFAHTDPGDLLARIICIDDEDELKALREAARAQGLEVMEQAGLVEYEGFALVQLGFDPDVLEACSHLATVAEQELREALESEEDYAPSGEVRQRTWNTMFNFGIYSTGDLRAAMLEMLSELHAEYPQYRESGYWEQDWQLIQVTERRSSHGVVQFEQGDVTVALLEQGILGSHTILWSWRLGWAVGTIAKNYVKL